MPCKILIYDSNYCRHPPVGSEERTENVAEDPDSLVRFVSSVRNNVNSDNYQWQENISVLLEAVTINIVVTIMSNIFQKLFHCHCSWWSGARWERWPWQEHCPPLWTTTECRWDGSYSDHKTCKKTFHSHSEKIFSHFLRKLSECKCKNGNALRYNDQLNWNSC